MSRTRAAADEDDYDDEWWEDDEGEWETWPMMPVHPVQDGEVDE